MFRHEYKYLNKVIYAMRAQNKNIFDAVKLAAEHVGYPTPINESDEDPATTMRALDEWIRDNYAQ